MAKIDPSKLTVDFKSLMRLSMSDRYAMAQSSQGRSYLASLTPTEFALLFPDYYRKRLPDMGISGGGRGKTGSITPFRPSDSTKPPSGTPPTNSTVTKVPEPLNRPAPTPQTSQEAIPSWQKRIMDIVGKSKETDSNKPSPSVGSLGFIRSQQMKQLDDPKVRAAVLARAEIEVGSQKKSQQAWLESLFNRAAANNLSLYDAVSNTSKHRYYPLKDNSRWAAMAANQESTIKSLDGKFSGHLSAVGSGSNITNYATDNASGALGRRKHEKYGGMWIEGEHYTSDPGTRRNWSIKQRRTDEEIKRNGGIIDASTAQPGDPSRTGSTSIQPLKSREQKPPVITTDPEELKRLNKSREQFFKGTLHMEGVAYSFGTGRPGRQNMQKSSVPLGTHEIEGLRNWSNYPQFVNNSFGVKNMFDEKLQRLRQGILIHSQTDLNELYSSGCIAISKKEWPKFKAHMLDYIKRNGPMSITIGPDNTAYIAPRGTDPLLAVSKVTEGMPKLPQGVDPKDAIELDKRLPKDLHPNIVKYYNEKLNINERKAFLDAIEKDPKILETINKAAADESVVAQNKIEMNKSIGNLVTAVQEDTLPESLLNLRVKNDRGETKTLGEMGVTKFSELTSKGGQAFSGGTNERNTTILAGEIQQHFGNKFGRVTAQNDKYHHGLSYKSGHTRGNKLDFTLNDISYSEGHKMLSKHLKDKYGMEEGKHFKIISKAHGTGPHIDFELTPIGQQTISESLQPKSTEAISKETLPQKIFVAGLENRGENFEQQTKRMGPNTSAFRHNANINDIIKAAQENPNAPITLFSAGSKDKNIRALLDAGIPASRITVIEPYKPNPDTIRSLTEQGGKYVYGSSPETGNFRGVGDLPNSSQRTGKSHFDAIRPPVVPVQEQSAIQSASETTRPETPVGDSSLKPLADKPIPAKYAGGEIQTRGDTAMVVNSKGEPLARINPDKERISLTESGNINVQPEYRTDPKTLEQQNEQRQQMADINIDDKLQEMSAKIMSQVSQMIPPPQPNNPNWSGMMVDTVNPAAFQNESFRRAMAGTRFEKTGDVALGGHFEIANSNLT